MKVLIIGSGNMGHAIATRLLAGGHAPSLYDIDPVAASGAAARLGKEANVHVVEELVPAVREHDVVVLASWYGANLDTARRLAPELAGKMVVDISNPLNESYDGLVTESGTSAAETIAEVLPGASVVKAFNTTFAGTLVAGRVGGHTLDVLIAGDDAAAKGRLARLVRDGGMNPVDVGGLERSRQLEALGLLEITLQGPLGSAFMSGWKLVLPESAQLERAA